MFKVFAGSRSSSCPSCPPPSIVRRFSRERRWWRSPGIRSRRLAIHSPDRRSEKTSWTKCTSWSDKTDPIDKGTLGSTSQPNKARTQKQNKRPPCQPIAKGVPTHLEHDIHTASRSSPHGISAHPLAGSDGAVTVSFAASATFTDSALRRLIPPTKSRFQREDARNLNPEEQPPLTSNHSSP